MGQLLEFVKSDPNIGDLQTLAFRSGVEYLLLTMIDEGSVTLSPQHIDALESILGSDSLGMLNADGSTNQLDPVVSRKGAPPVGYQLKVVAASDFQVGDMISYVPKVSEVGSQWVEIDYVRTRKSRNQFYVDLFVGGDRLVIAKAKQIIRIARRAAN